MNIGLITGFFSFIRTGILALILLVAGALIAAPTQAQSLDEAKAQGLVGERIDGLLGAPNGSPAGSIAAMIDSINSKRMEKYRSIAASNGTSVQAVQAIVGRKLIDKAGPGQYVDEGSGWRKK